MRARHFHLLSSAILAVTAISSAWGQVTYLDCSVPGMNWTNGTHHVSVPQKIYSPGDPALPTSISATADAEFVSATQVKLTPGFHAGAFAGSGRFRAHIDQSLGDPTDLVVIAPNPATHITDNVLHVEKWEKLEIGLRLPQDYQDAIQSFFAHYYDANGNATPNNLDRPHDLNPYAGW